MHDHLITINLTAEHHMHAFVHCREDPRIFEALGDRMFKEAEDLGIRPLRIFLCTSLGHKNKTLRIILEKRFEEIKQPLKSGEDMALIWILHMNDPDDKKLMKLH